MQIIITKNYDEMSQKAAEIIKQSLLKKPNLVLGLATGSTPLGTYQEIIKMRKKEKLDFSQVTTFNLDEYVNLSSDHPQSYNHYMQKNLFQQINLQEKNIFIPDGKAQDLDKYCAWYEEKIQEKGGIDLQIVGIGRNGHIGFNEPGSKFSSQTRVISLDRKTIEDNARFFADISQVPRKAITMGIAGILQAKKILLLANGEHKAEIIFQALQGQVNEDIPASALQKHPDLVVILDQEAGKLIQN